MVGLILRTDSLRLSREQLSEKHLEVRWCVSTLRIILQYSAEAAVDHLLRFDDKMIRSPRQR